MDSHSPPSRRSSTQSFDDMPLNDDRADCENEEFMDFAARYPRGRPSMADALRIEELLVFETKNQRKTSESTFDVSCEEAVCVTAENLANKVSPSIEGKIVVQEVIDHTPNSTSQNCQENRVNGQNLVSDILVISEPKRKEKISPTEAAPAVVAMTPPEKKVKKVERPKSKPAPPPSPPRKINRDECDWDSLFDDNGDCLDPSLIDEVGLMMYMLVYVFGVDIF